jgi:hypothetical protein
MEPVPVPLMLVTAVIAVAMLVAASPAAQAGPGQGRERGVPTASYANQGMPGFVQPRPSWEYVPRWGGSKWSTGTSTPRWVTPYGSVEPPRRRVYTSGPRRPGTGNWQYNP